MMALKERKKALAGSVVKIAARDVMLSQKIIISIVVVPMLWIFYSVLLMLLCDWNFSTKVNELLQIVGPKGPNDMFFLHGSVRLSMFGWHHTST